MKYLMRLDDASDQMDISRWKKIEELLDKYSIKPIFGIIPSNKDPELLNKYEYNPNFWEIVDAWIRKGWSPALHGYEHLYITNDGGMNPINNISEFAGLSYEKQAKKMERGWKLLKEHGIEPEIFFAPAHTFDGNTLEAIKNKTSIRIISDTIACDVYREGAFWFIPQQSGKVRKIGWPCKLVTFCYHPNTMGDADYKILEDFLGKNGKQFVAFEQSLLKSRKFGMLDWMLRKLYFCRKRT